jgi:hypothetical protein
MIHSSICMCFLVFVFLCFLDQQCRCQVLFCNASVPPATRCLDCLLDSSVGEVAICSRSSVAVMKAFKRRLRSFGISHLNLYKLFCVVVEMSCLYNGKTFCKRLKIRVLNFGINIDA